jgi:hypothetical protein
MPQRGIGETVDPADQLWNASDEVDTAFGDPGIVLVDTPG